jgi:hypothetical protein
VSTTATRTASRRGIIGAPSRTRSHFERILALLRERGAQGVSGSEMYDAPHLFGRSPRNRVSEIRAVFGKQSVETIPVGEHDCRYVWHPENVTGSLERPARRRAKQLVLAVDTPATGADSADWYARATGKARPTVAPETLFVWERRP